MDMHPLCSLAGEWQSNGTGLTSSCTEEEFDEAPTPVVTGALYKWTNIV
jgi:hypothetical protein